MDNNEVNHIFRKFGNVKALVIGDAMVDSYLRGRVDRISPEAPIPIIAVNKQECRLGGAANVSLNLQVLGATPFLVAMVGDDSQGDTFMELMKKRGLSEEGIIRTSKRRTTLKTRILSGSQQVVRVDEEVSDYIQPEEEEIVYSRVVSLMDSNDFDILIFVDYDKGVITPNLIKRITKLARAKGIKIAVDPKFRNFKKYNGVDLFKPNFNEFKKGIGKNIEKQNWV